MDRWMEHCRVPAGIGAVLLAFAVGRSVMAQDRGDESFAEARAEMIETIRIHARYAEDALGPEGIDHRVLEAMGRVPRHLFVPAGWRYAAYEDQPLPIGAGQTISQPFIVALMSDLVDVGAGERVLEVGTGSGYQAAVLAELGAEVYTVEIVPELGERAAATLKELGYDRVQVRVGDGYQGWPEAAPFDGVIVTAAPPEIPQPLLDQLKAGGRMVIPVGPVFDAQDLLLVTKGADGKTTTQEVLPVRFVPLTRKSPD